VLVSSPVKIRVKMDIFPTNHLETYGRVENVLKGKCCTNLQAPEDSPPCLVRSCDVMSDFPVWNRRHTVDTGECFIHIWRIHSYIITYRPITSKNVYIHGYINTLKASKNQCNIYISILFQAVLRGYFIHPKRKTSVKWWTAHSADFIQ